MSVPFLLRPWRDGDQGALQHHADNPLVSAHLRDAFPYPYTAADADWYVRFGSHADGQISLAIEVEGEAVGSIGVVRQHDIYRVNAEVGYWLGQQYWGQGIVTAALRQVVPLAFAQWPEVRRIFAGIFAQNKASMRVLEKAGFTHEALVRHSLIKNGVVSDEHRYAIWRDSPLPPAEVPVQA